VRVGIATLLGLDEQPGEIAGWGPVPASVARALVAQQRRCEWRYAIVDAQGRLLADGITRHRPTDPPPGDPPPGDRPPTGRPPTGPPPGDPPPGENPVGARVRGGIVELQIRAALLDRLVADPQRLAAEHPGWARLLGDLHRQVARAAPIVQDPTARFPGRPLRRRSQIRHRTCLFPGCRRPAAGCDQDHRHDHAAGGPTLETNLGPSCRHDHHLKTRRGWRLIKRDQVTYLWISPRGRHHLTHIDPIAPPLPTPEDPDPPG